MNRFVTIPIFILLAFVISGCVFQEQQSIINRYAEVLLTKNNELQFRFKINDAIFQDEQLYKVKVLIHNKKLASALGTSEIIYGQNTVYKGEYLEVDNKKEPVIYMTPIPLKKDLHPFEIKKMIVEDHAVTVEVYNDTKIIATAKLTNFATQL